MKTKLLLLLTFVTGSLFAQRFDEPFESQKLGVARDISIILPPSYESAKEKKYPVFVVLDSEYLLDPVLGTMKYGAYWDDLPEVIIVGINQNKGNEREYDTQFDEDGLPTEQGAKFFEFVGMELLPFIEKKFRVAPFRMIVGHDLTASFINAYLYKDNPVFNAYLCLSPELPAEMETRIPERLKIAQKPIFYYLATADGDLKPMRERIKVLDEGAKAVKSDFVKYSFDDFKNTSHYSLVPAAINSAIATIFEGYQPISMNEFQEKLGKQEKGHTQYLVDKYANIQKKLGFMPRIRLSDFKAIEAAIMKNKNYEDFLPLSELAKKNYPKTMLSEYHKAMYYDNMGEPAKAQKAFMTAFGQAPIRDLTKDMMLERADAIKGQLKKEKNRDKEVTEEPTEAPAETPADAPTETPTETPAEQPKQ
ncbi:MULTISPECIES: alpha/beta hydrolase-fold protein [Flavobacterium]|uniref:alpha/beta hydrolase-fold protein n=1 Tax=Flavobacterium TaxID=237 RepID=UPI001FCC0852|nr:MULTISPECIES: alpha/beta hydrolase-fold protein [Flavobacterium]UOK43008.1 alpha/beta hydrolase [Flavobacterium enshiense]